MPAKRRPGMDHEHYPWSPIHTREPLHWPDNARVALCVLVNLELMELDPPEGNFEATRLAGGGSGGSHTPITPACRIASTATGWAFSACSTSWKNTVLPPPLPWMR